MDCATKLTSDLVSALKKTGITHVARYLGTSWKGLTVDEVKAISDSGIHLVSVFETNPIQSAYFSQAQGKQDARNASQYAKDLGQTNGSAIYFAVDYDAQGKDLGAILDYFSGVNQGIDPAFKVGAYGSYAVLQYIMQQSKVDYFFQTYAWSYGQVCDFAHLYQFQNGVNVAGVNADKDQVNKEPGAWSLPKPKPIITPKVEVKSKVAVIPYPGYLIELKTPYMQGDPEKQIQHALNIAVGKTIVKEDGKYGPETKKAVMDYQDRHGIKVDGIVGPETWNTLF